MATVVLYICITLGVVVCLLCIALIVVAIRLTIRLRSLAKSIEQTERQVSERVQYIQLATMGIGLVRQLVAKLPVATKHSSSRANNTPKRKLSPKRLVEKLWPKK